MEKEVRQHLLSVKKAEGESRRLARELAEFETCKIKVGKYEDLLEIQGIENNELHRKIVNLKQQMSEYAHSLRRRDPTKAPAEQVEQPELGERSNTPEPDEWSKSDVTMLPDVEEINLQKIQSLEEELEMHHESDDNDDSKSESSQDFTRRRSRSTSQAAEDYLLMSARAVKIQFPEVDITFEELVNMARGLKFWQVYPFYIQTMKTLKMKEDGMRARGGGNPGSFFTKMKSLFSTENGPQPPQQQRRRAHSLGVWG